MASNDSSVRTGDDSSGAVGDVQDQTVAVADGGINDDALVKEWTVFIGSLLTTIGVGIGVLWFVLDRMSLSMYEPEVGDGSFHAWGFTSSMTVAMAIAVFVGVFLAWRLGPRQNATKVAAVSVLVGTFGLLVTRLLIRSTLSDNSVAFDGVLINSLATAVVAAGVAAAGVWIAQNLAPTGSGLETSRKARVSGQTSD